MKIRNQDRDLLINRNSGESFGAFQWCQSLESMDEISHWLECMPYLIRHGEAYALLLPETLTVANRRVVYPRDWILWNDGVYTVFDESAVKANFKSVHKVKVF